MAEQEVRDLHQRSGEKHPVCRECRTPYPCKTILALGDDLLYPPLQLPQNTDGSWPGDPRFAVRVRTVYGALVEQVVEAVSLQDALTKAQAIPLAAWLETDMPEAPNSSEAAGAEPNNHPMEEQ